MKKRIFILFCILLSLTLVANGHPHHGGRGRNPRPSVGAPLDGGLLLLLGGAGAAYYSLRKKKEN